MKLIESKEIWRLISGYENIYKISNYGQVKRLKSHDLRGRNVKEKILKNILGNHGYYRVTLCNGIQKAFTLHRLLALAFLPNPFKYPCINHKNGVKTDNRLENLEWCSYSHNQSHAIRTGLSPKPPPKFGKNHHNAKFDLNYFNVILKARNDGMLLKDILKNFKISQTHYYRIVNRETWQQTNRYNDNPIN